MPAIHYIIAQTGSFFKAIPAILSRQMLMRQILFVPVYEVLMKKQGYYSSGQFARLARVSVRTIRFYDKQNILKPSYTSESGARFYTDQDLVSLQQILLFKYLGFSLDDIRQMTIDSADSSFMQHSLQIQEKLISDQIEQLQLVKRAISDTREIMKKEHTVNWSRMLELIHMTNMEQSLSNQYKNAANLSARIRLHTLFSQNRQGWFPWVFEQCEIKEGMNILEIGCGDGSLWAENRDKIPANVTITLSDVSDGMIRDARRKIGSDDHRFSFRIFDCAHLPFPADSFDLVIANHVLFYVNDIPQVCREAHRVLKEGGRFICSTYSGRHMKEIGDLVTTLDERVALSADHLYEKFGLDNGEQLLSCAFPKAQQRIYQDSLEVTQPEPLIEYILSCHGNQNQYLLDRYKELRSFVEEKTTPAFHITKEAGIFMCKK